MKWKSISLLILLIFSLQFCFSCKGVIRIKKTTESTPAAIELITIPAIGSTTDLVGRVNNHDPSTHKIAVYISFTGVDGWWNKPSWGAAITDIDSDRTFSCDITTSANDIYANKIAVFLIPDSYTPPNMSGQFTLPQTLYDNAVAYLIHDRLSVTFSGYTWSIKLAEAAKVGPGLNYFTYNSSDVYVDSNGWLHLKIVNRNSKWYSAEIISDRSFGYGTYVFHLASRTGTLDKNIIVGLFTWDDDADGLLVNSNREIDFEFSRWGFDVNNNFQFVVQPFGHSSSPRHRFNLNSSVDTVHIFTWNAATIDFQSATGNIYPPSSILETWSYSDVCVPNEGNEKVHINFWLYGGAAPSDGLSSEVVIKKFQFIP